MTVDYEREGPTSIWVVTVSHTSCRAAWNHCRGFVSRDGCVRAATASPDRRARGTEYSSIPCSWSFATRFPRRPRSTDHAPVPRPPPRTPRPRAPLCRRSNDDGRTLNLRPTCYDATSGPGTRRRVCAVSARSPTGGSGSRSWTRRGAGAGAAVASSGDNAFLLSFRTTWSWTPSPPGGSVQRSYAGGRAYNGT